MICSSRRVMHRSTLLPLSRPIAVVAKMTICPLPLPTRQRQEHPIQHPRACSQHSVGIMVLLAIVVVMVGHWTRRLVVAVTDNGKCCRLYGIVGEVVGKGTGKSQLAPLRVDEIDGNKVVRKGKGEYNIILCCYAIVRFVRQSGQSSRKVLQTFQESSKKPSVN